MKKIFVCLLIASLSVFCNLSAFAQNPSYQQNSSKMMQMLQAINNMYVDTVNFEPLVEKSIVEMLKELDPHSVYIPKKEVQQTNEPLEGKFDGIGVTFQLIKDTINVMEVIPDGPSDKVGLRAGDKIVRVDTAIACGKHVNNKWVQSHLRGVKGTKVVVGVKRGRNPEILEFTITRDKIPMNSVNVSFMVDDKTGYIKLDRFAMTSPNEVHTALTKLNARGMKNLILDLRGNGGGYLDVAFKISNIFLGADQMIVYTDNFRKTGQQFKSDGKGEFQKGRLIVLVDEGSASASEIVSGCIQDWDRGLVVGRRTFGKGLVQKPLYLNDQSMVRLTISHYYTPTGRCIQKPYSDGVESYLNDLNNRSKHGEYLTADSIKFPDSLKYTTPRGRVVYGGGGIMPDIFIPLDTSKYSTFYNELARKGIFGGFTMDYMETHREEMKAKYPTFEDYKQNFNIDDKLYDEFIQYAKKEGVTDSLKFVFSSYLQGFVKENKGKLDSMYSKNFDNKAEFDQMLSEYIQKQQKEAMRLKNLNKAPEYIKEYLKFEIARTLYSYGEAYQVFLTSDDTFLQAVDIMKDNKIFKKFKVND
ncbi:MAG: PDZ domain-containing protein [Bacteroidales bacterium]|nr:PDZ domain-containing protein [Bacteroidales bacterium]